jgi:hypothetical protein
MTQIELEYCFVVLLWIATLGALLAQAWRGSTPVVGITLSYWFGLALIHLAGGLIYFSSWYQNVHREDTIAGFRLTGYAMAGLLMGNFLLAPYVFAMLCERGRRSPRKTARHQSRGPLPARIADVAPVSLATIAADKLGKQYIMIGLLANFGLILLFGWIPSARAVFSGGLAMAEGGFCLWWWHFWKGGHRHLSWGIACGSLILPVMTLLFGGYLGYGVYALAPLACLILVYYRPRATVLTAGLIALFLSLSLYPAYFKARAEIRRVVWGHQNFDERVEVTYSSIKENWNWFDTDDISQLDAIDARLNQNYFIGMAERRLAAEHVPFASGKTFVSALLAMIPRILWPDKPEWAGTTELVTEFTGMEFSIGTSVGIGHVMEFYVNFGEPGLLIGYLILGTLLGTVDRMAGRYLRAGRSAKFMVWFVFGQALLMVGGNFAELTASALGWTTLAIVVNFYTMAHERGHPTLRRLVSRVTSGAGAPRHYPHLDRDARAR